MQVNKQSNKGKLQLTQIEKWLRKFARRYAPKAFVNWAVPHVIQIFFKKHGCKIRFGQQTIEITKEQKCIRLSRSHLIHAPEILHYFDLFFDSVKPKKEGSMNCVDFSKPQYHHINGYDKHPILLPSISEPLATTQQYLDFAQLQAGDVVLDLGAYCGLTSILFKEAVGAEGQVIAVEADAINLKCTQENLKAYEQHSTQSIDLLNAAIWKQDGELSFATEGSMGSSAVEIVGQNRGESTQVKAMRLASIARHYHLEKVDFIKCDIEGAEAVIFDQAEFFEQFKPKIIIEPHHIEGKLTDTACINTLKKYGYECVRITQVGSETPLLAFNPT